MADETPQTPQPSLWRYLKDGAPLILVALTALGTTCGWLFYQSRYSWRFGISLHELPLSVSDYLIAGLVPLGVMVAGMAVGVISAATWMESRVFYTGILLNNLSREWRKMLFELRRKELRKMRLVGVAAIAVVSALTAWLVWPIRAEHLGILFLACGGFIGIVTTKRLRGFGSWRFYGGTGAISASFAMLFAVVIGAVECLELMTTEDRSYEVQFSESPVQEAIKDKKLAVAAHASATWYFVDKDSDWRKPTVYAIPDSLVRSVVKKGR